MEQVAHQTIVMQFILELAKSLKVDPRGCFRQFFEKIKVTVWRLENHSSFKVQVECSLRNKKKLCRLPDGRSTVPGRLQRRAGVL